MASALAVELLVSLLQQDLKDVENNAKSILGKIPHQIRGNLSNQETFTLSGTAFENCTCCSELILSKFEEDGFEFVKAACNDSTELENISGLTEMKLVAEKISEVYVQDDDEDSDNDF